MVLRALREKAASDATLSALVAEHERECACDIVCVRAFRREANQRFDWLGQAPSVRDEPRRFAPPGNAVGLC